MGKLWIYLPGSDTPALATEAQFEKVWESREYKRVEPDLRHAANAGYVISGEEDLPAGYIAAVLADRAATAAEQPAEAESAAPSTKKKTPASSQAATTGEGDR